jgi:sugar lactone lactonase YvrE
VSNEENITSTMKISGDLIVSRNLFVKIDGGIYVDNSDFKQPFDEQIFDSAVCFATMKFVSRCIAIFIDINYTFYCSINQEHQVVKLLHTPSSCAEETIAGSGTNGSMPHLLSHPNGIFVDINLDLYVADSGNNRIQLFHPGNENGTTVAGSEDLEHNGLNYPTAVIVDTLGYLFIADWGNHRIIRSHRNGFRCIVGCSKNNDSASNQLYYPQALWFDSSGSMFVLDKNNTRIQRFLLSTDSCGMLHS